MFGSPDRFTRVVIVLLPVIAMLVIPHSGLAVEFGPTRVLDGSSTLVDATRASVDFRARGSIGASDSLEVRVPASGNGAVTKTWTFTAEDESINNGRPFLLASGRTTFRFKLIQAGYKKVTPGYWRSISQYEFDDFYNICLDGDHTTYAKGGVIYCDDWVGRTVESEPRKVRVTTKTTGVKDYPRPVLVSDTSKVEVLSESGTAPSCTPGETKVVPFDTYDNVHTCIADDSQGLKTRTIVRRIWSKKGWSEVVDTVKTNLDAVPDWSVAKFVPLPAPTATIDSTDRPVSSWTITGTLTNPNTGSCMSGLRLKKPDGTWVNTPVNAAGSLESAWVSASGTLAFTTPKQSFIPIAAEGRWSSSVPCLNGGTNPPVLSASITASTPNYDNYLVRGTITNPFRRTCKGNLFFDYQTVRPVEYPSGVSSYEVTVPVTLAGPPKTVLLGCTR